MEMRYQLDDDLRKTIKLLVKAQSTSNQFLIESRARSVATYWQSI